MNRKIKNITLTLILLTLTYTSFSATQKKILFVMSAADTLTLNDGQKLRQTGVFLNEFYMVYKSVSDNGYTVDFATPNGIVATIDQESINDKYWESTLSLKGEAVKFIKENNGFNNPLSLEKAIENKHEYIGLIIPGGQGLMVDLRADKNLPVLLKHFALENKPTGLICHAPSLILTIPKDENPYVGYQVNSVSPMEEFVIEKFIMKGKPANRKIARSLRKLGLKYRHGKPRANFAFKDRHLVTSQNPYSSQAFNILYLEALNEYLSKNG